MNILITGAAGYIGRNLAKQLARNKSFQIYGLSRSQIELPESNFHSLTADLTDPGFVSQLPGGIDVVYHLAQSKQYRNFPDGAEDMFKVNVLSTQVLLEWARKTNVKKFIFTSTGNVYKQADKLLTEDDRCEPAGYYGASKYAAEQLILPYHTLFETVILRVFGVYGPGQENMLIPNLIDRIRKKETVTLADNAGLYLTPLYIDDCVKIMEDLLHKKADNLIYNLAGNTRTNLLEISRLISKKLGISLNTQSTSQKAAYLIADNSKLKKALGFEPSVGIELGIHNVLT